MAIPCHAEHGRQATTTVVARACQAWLPMSLIMRDSPLFLAQTSTGTISAALRAGSETGGMTPAIVNDRDRGNCRCRYECEECQNPLEQATGPAEFERHADCQPDSSAKGGEKCTFYEELGRNIFVRSPKSFPQSYFAGALGHRDQHNVDDADRAKT